MQESLILRKTFFFYAIKEEINAKKTKKIVIFLTISIDNMLSYGYN